MQNAHAEELMNLTLFQLLNTFNKVMVRFESESKKVGNVAVPASLIDAMRASPCLRLELSDAQRVELLRAVAGHATRQHLALPERHRQGERLERHERLAQIAARDVGYLERFGFRAGDEQYVPARIGGVRHGHAVDAALLGEEDRLESVVENVMLNQPVPVGTGLPGLVVLKAK